MQTPIKIGIIGGGRRCRAFLEMFDSLRFPKLGAEIVSVADPDLEAPGIRLAREKKILVTTDYKDFYDLKDLDLVIELTGKEDLLEDFLKHKPAGVRVLESAISKIFGDVLCLSEEYQFAKRQINLVEGIGPPGNRTPPRCTVSSFRRPPHGSICPQFRLCSCERR